MRSLVAVPSVEAEAALFVVVVVVVVVLVVVVVVVVVLLVRACVLLFKVLWTANAAVVAGAVILEGLVVRHPHGGKRHRLSKTCAG